MISMIQALVILLLFLPGSALLYVISQKKELSLSKLEMLLAGSILWNYILVTSSLILGVFASTTTVLFWPLNLIGGLLLMWFIWIIFRKKPRFGNFLILKVDWVWILPFMLLLPLLLGITLYHPLFYEWDAVSIYLPTGKSIATTGELFNHYWNSYYPVSQSMLSAIIYAWSYNVIGDIPDILPFFYILLMAISVFCISRRTGQSRLAALTATLTVLSIPSIVRYLAVDSLYADLPFVFYTSVGILFALKFVQEKSSIALLFVSIAICLAALSKAIGLIFLSLLLAILVMHSVAQRNSIRSLLYVLVANIIFIFFLAWNFIFYPSESPAYFAKTVGPTIPITILAILLFIYGLRYSFHGNFNRPKTLDWLSFILPVVPLGILTLWDALIHGFVFGWGPGLKEGLDLFALVRSPEASIFSLRPQIADVVGLISWYPIFLSLALGAPFILPLILGLLENARKVNSATFIILSWFTILIAVWTLFFLNKFEYGEYRRLLYFAPIVSVFVGEGVHSLCNRYGLNEKHMWYGFVAYNSFVWVYTWNYYFKGDLIDNIISLKNIGAIPDTLTYNTYIFVFVAILAFVWVTKRVQICVLKVRKINPSIILLAVLLLSQIALAQSVIIPFFQYVVKTSWDPKHYNVVQDYRWGEGIFEAVDFYRENIKDSYVTLGFRIYYLALYANRSIIDLSTPSSYQTIAHILKTNDTSRIIELLYDSGIRYFLLPKPSAALAYEVFSSAKNHFQVIRMIEEHECFVLLAEFSNFRLYKLRSPQEYKEYVEKLRELFFLEENPFIISDDDQSALYWRNLPGAISLSDDSNVKIAGKNSLKIQIFKYSGDKNLVIRYQFSKPIDISGYDFVAFYLYGKNTSMTLSIRMISNYPSDQYTYEFKVTWNGWARVIIPLRLFKILVGTPNLSNITYFAIAIQEVKIEHDVTFYLDRVTVDKGVTDYYLILLEKLEE